MSDESFFTLYGYGVKLSDLIATTALVISAFVAVTTRLDTKLIRQREREEKLAKTKLRPAIHDVWHDNKQMVRDRGVTLYLNPAEDGIRHVIQSCELLEPKASHLEINVDTKLFVTGGDGLARFQIGVGDEPVSVFVHERSTERIVGPLKLRFHSIRHDAAHSPSTVDVIIPLGKPRPGADF